MPNQPSSETAKAIAEARVGELARALVFCCCALAAAPAAATDVPFTTEHTVDGAFNGARSVHAADIDGDGDIDVLAAAKDGDEVTWWENTAGDGSAWTEHLVDGAFDGARSIFAADVDGDGDTDVLAAAQNDNAVSWWENTAGDGTAWTEHLVDGAFTGAKSVFAVDVDGDGDTDVLGAAPADDDVSWWENTAGDGSAWTEHLVDGAFTGANAVFAADVDGDGDVDVLGAADAPDDISWWENTAGDGSVWTEHVVDPALPGVRQVFAADIDGDGDTDVLGAVGADNDIAWFENTVGDGSAWTKRLVDGDFDGAISVFAADIDGDGDTDVLGAADIDDDITWWENTAGDGTAWTERLVDGTFDGAKSVFAADVDGDGDLDVLGAADVDDDVTWWENETIHRSAVHPIEYTVDGAFDSVNSVYAADVDGDGDTDVLGAAGGSVDDITWWENTAGDGSTWTEHTVDGAFNGANTVVAADVDGDGDTDVLGAAGGADEIAWWENTAGDGSTWSKHTVDAAFNQPRSVVAADVDGDGDFDMLGAAYDDDDITWWENTAGDGSTWSEHPVDGTVPGASSVVAADVDGDGDIDVLGAALDADDIAWWENTVGDGSTWSEHTIDGAFDGARQVYAADVDGDGDIDVLGAAQDADDITWWENTAGDGSIWSEQTVGGAFDGARSVYAADVDGDGDIDVLGAARIADDITWWENTAGDGSTWTEHTIDGDFDFARSVHAADVDGDGDIDVLGAALVADDIAWWENRGGQFALATTDTAPATAAPGSEDDLLKIDMTHRGRSGDHDEELVTLNLLFEETPADPLTTAEANALIANLKIYLDDGSGSFEAGSDTLVTTVATLALTAGVQTVTFADGDANVQVAFGTPETFFVALELESLPMTTVGSVLVTHLTESTSTAEDRDADIPLTLEYVVDAASSLVSVPHADLSVTKTDGVTSAVPGQTTLIYTVVAANSGPDADPSATLTDTLPADLTCTYTSVAAGGATGNTASGSGDLSETLSLPAGSSVTYTVMCSIDVAATGTLSNTASISSSLTDGTLANNSATDADTVLAPEADLSVTKTDGVTSAMPGGSLPYTIVAANAGPSDVPSATLTDTLPADLTCIYSSVAAGGASGNTASGSGDLAETLALPAGSSVTYTLGCTIDGAATGTLSNTASISSAVTDPAPGNDSATDADTVLDPDAPNIIDGDFDGATAVAAADVDGDGDLDVLGAAIFGDDIAWWENTAGDGSTWTEHTVDADVDGATAVVAADVDGDGDIDVLGAAFHPDDIKWWENTAGDGSAWSEHLITGTFDGVREVVAADVDGDGDLDVLGSGQVASLGNEIKWWENTAGDGSTWTENLVDDNLGAPRGVVAADVDGDGDIDVLGAAVTANDITWWENTAGDGSTWSVQTIDGDFNGAISVAAADVDGDGDTDVLGAAFSGDDIAWWENTAGDGSTWSEHSVDGAFDGAFRVSAADMDGDGDTDVLGAASTDDDITWWENTAGDGSTWSEHTVDADFDGARSVAAADVDGDGDLDVLGAAVDGDDVAWWENETIHRSAVHPIEHTIDGDFNGARSVHAADVDGDGDTDLIGAAEAADDITWWENTAGDGSTWSEHTVDGDFDAATSVYAADVDGDGDIDVLGAAATADDITWWENTAGDGSTWSEHTVDGAFDGARQVFATDVDGDGDLDVLGTAFFDNDITWWENTAGDGSTWSEHIVDGAFDGARWVSAADVDGDGDLDVLGAAQTADDITWWENTSGDGSTWSEHTVDGAFDGAISVYAADVDGDGDIDVLGAARDGDDITWWENTVGDGSTWIGHTVDGAFDGAISVYAADVDGDGNTDVLGAARDGDDITWWENTAGDGSTWIEHTVDGTFNFATSVYAADVDGDGDLDVLGTAFFADDITWWENRGGQFALATTDTAPATAAPGSEDDLLKIDMTHRGRTGDHDEELVTFDLLFEETAADPLSTTEANALIANLRIYLDDGSGVFEAGSDTLVTTVGTLALTAGVQTVTFADGDTNVRVAFGTPETFFVALEFVGLPVTTVGSVRVTHLTESTSTAEDRDDDTPLTLEFVADAASTEVSVPHADLSVTKSDGVTSATPGGSLTYTIFASNSGPSADPSATLTDTLPADLTCTYTSVAAGGVTGHTLAGAGNLSETLSMPSGSSVTYTVSCSIDVAATGTLSNTASISSSLTDATPGNNSATDNDTALAPEADLSVTKTDGVTSAVPGGSLTYTIVAANAGPSDDPSATLTDTFPADLTCTYSSVAAGGASGNTTAGSGDLSETLALPSGSSVTYTVSCTIDPGATGTLSNTATISSATTDPTPGNNSDTDADTVLTATLVVNATGDTVADDGACTLREAITAANSDAASGAMAGECAAGGGIDTIAFTIAGPGPHTIQPTSQLPTVTQPLILDATTQSGTECAAGSLMVELDGSMAGVDADGLTITAGGSTVRGLVINRFDFYGIQLSGAGSTNNLVECNFIGTDVSGTAALGNRLTGVRISGGASSNTIGGTTPAARNLISANSRGIAISGSETTGNKVQGNFIGTDTTGTMDLGNGLPGIDITSGAHDNTIGGTEGTTPGGPCTGACNVISGNDFDGVRIRLSSNDNMVQGNFIGTDVSGTQPLGNTREGVYIREGASDNVIGGTEPAARNVISGSNQRGILLSIATTTGNLVQGNFIGTDTTGTMDLGNRTQGIDIVNGAHGNTIGGTEGTTPGGPCTGACNLISGNDLYGLLIRLGSDDNLVQGNFIGTDVSGTQPLGNTSDGVLIREAASGNVIGGMVAGAGNLIAANGRNGVRAESMANSVEGNRIEDNAASGIALVTGGDLASNTGNCITGNQAGVDNSTGVATDAEGNWWGHASGPGGLGPGFGDTISADVDAEPFLTAPPAGCRTNPTADLAIIAVADPDPATAGEGLTYTLTVNNLGPSAAVDAAVTLVLPAAVTLVSSAGCAEDPAGVPTCSLGTILSGGSRVVTLEVAVDAGTLDPLLLAAGVGSATVDDGPGNEAVEVMTAVTADADLFVTKTDGVTSATPGQSVTYTIVAANAGPSDEPSATLTDTFPADLMTCTYTSVAAGGASGNTAGSGNLAETLSLPAASSVTYTASCTIDVAATGTLSNTATITGSVNDSTPGNDSATDADTLLVPTTDLRITKSDSVDPVTAGEQLTYTLTVSNQGPSPVTDAVITDILPAEATLVSSSGCAEDPAGAPTCTVGTLAVREMKSAMLTVAIDSGALGTLINGAAVASEAVEANEGDETVEEETAVATEADLTLSMTDDPDPVAAGAEIVYTLSVANAGPSDARGVFLTDTLPVGATLVATSGCAQDPDGVPACSLGTIEAGGAREVTITVTAPPTTGVATNVAEVAANTSDPNPGDETASEETTVVGGTDLSLSMTDSPDPVAGGGTLTYTLTVFNDSAAAVAAADVVIADTLPAGVSLLATSGCAEDPDGVPTCSLGTVAAGATPQVTLTVAVDPTTAGLIDNLATVTASTPESNPGDETATATTTVTGSADLGVTKDNGQTSTVPGSGVTYTVTVSNAGPANVYAAAVADIFPSALEAVAWTCVSSPGSACTALGASDIADTVDLLAGGTLTYTAASTVAADATGTLANTATITAPAGVTDPVPANDVAIDTDVLTPVADLGITKDSGEDEAIPDKDLTYTLTVTNAGPGDVADAIVTDVFPPELTAVSWTCAAAAGSTCTAGPVAGDLTDIVDLPAGGSLVYTATGTVDADATGTLSNTATVAAPAGIDPDSANNSATDDDPLVPGTVAPTIPEEVSGGALPRVAYDDAGGFLVVWQDDAAGGIASRYITGVTLGEELLISKSGTQPVTLDGLDPAVAFDPAAGEFLVVWQRDATDESAIVGRRVSASMPLGGELLISSMPLGGELSLSHDPELAFDDAAQDFVVVWERRDEPGDTRQIQGRRVSLEGGFSMPLGGEFQISMPLGGELQHHKPAVAYDSTAQELLVVWQSDNAGGESEIVGRRAGLEGLTGGMPLGGEFSISMPLGGELSLTGDPSVAFDAESEEFLVVWRQEQTVDAAAITGRRVKIEPLGGMPLGGELQVSAAGAGDAGYPEISSALGSFVVVWEEAADASSAGQILGRLLDNAGVPRNIEFQVGDAGNADDSLPAISFAPPGPEVAVDEFVVVWQSEPPEGEEEVLGQVFVLTADLSITVADGVDPAAAGRLLSWTVTVANAGPADAEEVTVTDLLPGGVILVSTAGCAEDQGGAPTCTLGTILAGGSAQYTVTAAVDPGTLGTLVHAVSVESRAVDPDETDNAAVEETAVVAEADLAVDQADDPDPVSAGAPVTYTVTVTNDGPADAVGVLAAGALRGTILSATAGCEEDPEGVPVCTLGTVPADATREYTVTVEVDPAAAGPLEHTAVVSSETADPDAGNNASTETTAVVGSADLAITKSDDPDPLPVGGTVTYTLTVTNAGPSNASGVVVTEVLPAGMTPEATAGCAEDPAGVPTCTLGEIATGASREVILTATLDQASEPLINTASVAAVTPDPEPANNTASEDTTPILSPAEVSGTMEVEGIFALGSIVTYTTVLINDGPGTQLDNPGDEFVDPLPAELELIEVSADSGTIGFVGNSGPTRGGEADGGARVTWNGSIPAGGIVTLVIEARIGDAAIGQMILNQGMIHYDADGDGSNEASTPTQDPAGGATSFRVLALIEIPALGKAGLAALALLLAGLALAVLRRRRAA